MFKTQHLYQNDNKWKNVRLGNSSETIGSWGGMLTAITMTLNGLGYSETPITVNEKLKKAGGFLKALPGPTDVGLRWANCVYWDMDPCKTSVPIAKIDAAVEAGEPVVLQVHARKQTAMQTHFVLVKDKKGDDYVLYDPYKDSGDRPEKEVLLTARYKDHGGTLESEITAVLWFRRRSPAPRVPRGAKFPVPAGKFKLFATQDDVVLYDQPKDTSFPWKFMKKWTDLISLESKSVAKYRLDKASNGVPDQWLLVQDPDGDQGYVSALSVTAELPSLKGSLEETVLPVRKWFLKQVSVQSPEFWDDDGKPVTYTPPKSLTTLRRGTVVSVLKANEPIPGWAKVLYRETHHEKSAKPWRWVTTRVTGWVKDTDLDDYYEPEGQELRTSIVDIERQTESSTDAEQYFYIEGKTQANYNMCGELCVAAIVGRGIDRVLNQWRGHSKESEALYQSMVGRADKPLGPRHIESLLDAHGVEYICYKLDPSGKHGVKYINLADTDEEGRINGRCASEDLQTQIKDYYFITNLRIDTSTGDLQAVKEYGERNHWVVLTRITRDGSRVELYNPYLNQIEEYTFGEFYRSVEGNPNSGWWIRKDSYPALASHAIREEPSTGTTSGSSEAMAAGRKTAHSLLPVKTRVQPPTFSVAIDNQTTEARDAEQYLYIRGEGNQVKTKLCGEFCVAFILGQSLNTSLKHWLGKQEKLKKQGQQPKLWELAGLLQAYGFNRRKYLAPQKGKERERNKYYVATKVEAPKQGYFKSFSIDTVLEYWKGVQPDLYTSLLGGNRNEPTGPEDLITILKAYGYDKDDYSYYRPGSQEVFGYAPGRDAQVIGKTHYLLAGVNIHGTTGRLQPRGVAHWVVVTKLTPQGNMVGDNGGWVEIYNPFPNEWEEYSYREFMKAFNGMSEGTTLWIKKDVSPDFATQALAPAKSKEKDLKRSGKGNKNSKSNQKSAKKRKEEKDRERDKARGKRGGRVVEFDNEPPLDANQLVCERLDVKAIPWEIGKWILEASGGDRFFAQQLTDALVECGILSIQDVEIDQKKIRAAVHTDLVSSNRLNAAIKDSTESIASLAQDPVYRIARAVLPLFLPRVVEEIREIQKNVAFHAHQPWREFRAWTSGLSLKSLESLDPRIQETVERLPLAVHDREQLMRVCNLILTRPASSSIEEEIKSIFSNSEIMHPLNKVWDLKQGEKITLPQLREWIHGLAAPRRNDIYRVKRWGAPGTEELGLIVEKLYDQGESSNFQAVGLYNEATKDFGAISNYLIIPREDVLRLEALQVEDMYEQKRPDWLLQKMNWLCQHRGSIYMFAEADNYRGAWSWRREEGIRWGTLALGGNLVQVVGKKDMEVKLPAKKDPEMMTMARLRGFKQDDWGRPLDELLAEGLVHRCFCVNTGNDMGDGPQGIVYSPFWSPEDWVFRPQKQGVPAPKALWIPVAYLEEESKEMEANPQANP